MWERAVSGVASYLASRAGPRAVREQHKAGGMIDDEGSPAHRTGLVLFMCVWHSSVRDKGTFVLFVYFGIKVC